MLRCVVGIYALAGEKEQVRIIQSRKLELDIPEIMRKFLPHA